MTSETSSLVTHMRPLPQTLCPCVAPELRASEGLPGPPELWVGAGQASGVLKSHLPAQVREAGHLCSRLSFLAQQEVSGSRKRVGALDPETAP